MNLTHMFNKHFLALVLHCVYNIKTTRKTRSIIKYTFKITYSFSKPAFYLNSSHTFAEMLIVLVSLVVCVSSKSLPPEIQKCRKFDPKLGECLAEKVVDSMHRFKQGNKELGIVPLEPLVIQKLEFGNSGDGPVAIQQVYENLKLFGITAFTIYDSEANFSDENCYWRFKSYGNLVRMEADYKMSGQLLLFPINGHGKSNNTLYECEAVYNTRCEKYTKRNQKHIRMTDFVLKLKPKRIVFGFENLIDGNEQFSNEVLKTINENSEQVYADVAPAINEAIAKIEKEIVNQVFSRVPEDELFLS
ncbi:protein takeout-like isoform X2 [Zophobas morio]|uniref:protein takeout-like isoform X2 n=1 Tax=Zophobas morio TaxID=2755281 RepID=UPI003083B06D